MKNFKPLLALIVLFAAVPFCYQKDEPVVVPAVVAADPPQEEKTLIVRPQARQQMAVQPGPEPPVVIEGHRPRPARPKKVFTAAQFVCALPIENPETYTVILNNAEDAADAILQMKKDGCDEITLKNTQPGEVLDAIVKTAKRHDMRINA